MPTISEFLDIYILMFYDDHAPPHFHARYGDQEALIRISPVGMLKGDLPPRVLELWDLSWNGLVFTKKNSCTIGLWLQKKNN